jgi:hypothetical protein
MQCSIREYSRSPRRRRLRNRGGGSRGIDRKLDSDQGIDVVVSVLPRTHHPTLPIFPAQKADGIKWEGKV